MWTAFQYYGVEGDEVIEDFGEECTLVRHCGRLRYENGGVRYALTDPRNCSSLNKLVV
jgi:hypothetical protein